ncbi:hypothetical protein [Labedaea rhizosphaerae]|uniref:Capsular polysaccharide biosynthesis protein n=1 Tax=Labedaea rhizosphaerae TaxID=598644 RepID=A0A4R6SPT5_LABRH|nr:hypothetical protein [Labedaea rhizosphaerae]TDQ05522.1 hypothetical protein EV186_1011496 [Labedaea rhizosphaerae]
MDFIKTLLVLLKRWYVALPIFVIAVGAASLVYASVPVRYSSTGTVVLTAPTAGASSGQSSQERGQTNPLLAFDSSLSITASIIIQSMGTPQVATELGADKQNTFEVSSGELGGPFIVVQTESSSAQRAQAMVQQVIDRVRAQLDARQKTLKAPPSTFIKADEVVPASVPEKLLGGKMRAAGAALALGLFASLGSAFGIESVLARRRSSPKAKKPAKDPKPPVRHRDDDDDPPRSMSGTIDHPPEDRTVIMPRVRALNGSLRKGNVSTKTVPHTSPVSAAPRPVRRPPDSAADES